MVGRPRGPQFKPCAVDGCERNAHYSEKGMKGYCCAHYMRLTRHGDVLSGGTFRDEPLKFATETAVNFQGEDCLTWPFHEDGHGYGELQVGGTRWKAHRLVCQKVHGDPPTPEHEAAHNCGNGHLGCVNPNHLEWKTHAENMAMTVEHGTSGRGSSHPLSKLTEEDVLCILSLKGAASQRTIAERFGVTRQTVSDIHRGRRWGWLRDEEKVDGEYRHLKSIAA